MNQDIYLDPKEIKTIKCDQDAIKIVFQKNEFHFIVSI